MRVQYQQQLDNILSELVEMTGGVRAALSQATDALLSAVPLPDPHRERTRLRAMLRDDPGADPPSGCRFRTRCPTFATLPAHDGRRCVEEEPAVRRVRSGQSAACHFPHERSSR